METVNLNMEDIFEEQDDDFPTVGVLPDLPEEDGSEVQQVDEDDAENSEVLSKLKNLSKGASKKVVRKPQPKLDGARLTGERGIPIIPKKFQDVKFKGKGHEAQDLGIIMRYLEHWAHRLFPKMPFDEVLERIEKLGTKKEVQTCIKKMRMDMPILNGDFVGTEAASDEEEGVNGQTNGANHADGAQPDIDKDAEEAWDELFRQEDEERRQKETPVKSSHLLTALSQPDTLANGPYTPSTPSTPHTPLTNGVFSPGQGLTPEQIERMERNRKLAMEKRNKGKAVFKIPAAPVPSASGSPVNHTKAPPSSTMSSPAHTPINRLSGSINDSDKMSEVISQQDKDIVIAANNPSTPDTCNLSETGDESEMSEVFPMANKTTVYLSQKNNTDSSSQEMSEVIPLVSMAPKENGAVFEECSPCKTRKLDGP